MNINTRLARRWSAPVQGFTVIEYGKNKCGFLAKKKKNKINGGIHYQKQNPGRVQPCCQINLARLVVFLSCFCNASVSPLCDPFKRGIIRLRGRRSVIYMRVRIFEKRASTIATSACFITQINRFIFCFLSAPVYSLCVLYT